MLNMKAYAFIYSALDFFLIKFFPTFRWPWPLTY